MKRSEKRQSRPLAVAEKSVTGMKTCGRIPADDCNQEPSADQQLTRLMLEWHERDRRMIAYELHDGFVQQVTGARMHLERLLAQAETALTGVAREEVETALELIRKSIGEARRLISGLRPPILDECGVMAAIKYTIDEQPDDGPSIRLKVDEPFERLEPLLETAIFRIAQEAMTNAIRHSRSEQIEIRVGRADDRIELEIVDRGVGFDPATVAENRFGLRGIRERARLLCGRAKIDSVPGHGTRVFVELPTTPKHGESGKGERSE